MMTILGLVINFLFFSLDFEKKCLYEYCHVDLVVYLLIKNIGDDD
jgi:hypothetical protein